MTADQIIAHLELLGCTSRTARLPGVSGVRLVRNCYYLTYRASKQRWVIYRRAGGVEYTLHPQGWNAVDPSWWVWLTSDILNEFIEKSNDL